MGRHLTKLPEKSFAVAEGDVVGGLIYVMDKPLGIEEGMVGMSIDAPAYREFIKSVLADLDNPDFKTLKVRYDKIVKFDSFDNLTPEEKELVVDLMLYDPKIPQHIAQLKEQSLSTADLTKSRIADQKLRMIEKLFQIDIYNLPQNGILTKEDNPYQKRRYGPSLSEARKLFFSTGKLHEIKAGQAYYVNKGMGGLLLNAYKTKCKVEGKDHFATKIKKLIEGGKNNPTPDETNKVYMVKQDGKMVLGGTGPGWNKMMKTTMGKSFQFLANPFLVAATGGLTGIAYGAIMLGWRSFYLRKNKPTSANSDAIVESLATKLAKIRGMNAQEIDTIEGTYADGSPKIATVVTWTPGCKDLSGRLSGGESELSSVAILQTDKAERYKVDAQDNLLKEIKQDGKVVGYEKMDKNGHITENISKQEFDAAFALSDDRIAGLGQSLVGMLSAGDRDGIGKQGQNKAIIPLIPIPPQDPKIYQFYGIDYGKAYQNDNPIIDSLQDDFSFTNPTDKRERFSNYSMLYDNPLSEKMKGIYLLAALRDQLSGEQKEKIIQDYKTRGDNAFAQKLQNYPTSVGGPNQDLALIKSEEDKYRQLADEAKENGNIKKQNEYLSYVKRVSEVRRIAQETDHKILDKFSERMMLTPSQIDVLDNLEKLTSKKVSNLSPDGKVLLNHIRVEPQGRFKWQIDKNGSLVSDIIDKNKQEEIIKKLSDMKEALKEQQKKLPNEEVQRLIEVLDSTSVTVGSPIVLSAETSQLMSQHITESLVATAREITNFRTPSQRNDFHNRIKHYEQTKANKVEDKKTQDNVLAPGPALAPERNVHKESHEVRKKISPIFAGHRQIKEERLVPQNMLSQSNVEFHKLRDYINNYNEGSRNSTGIQLEIPDKGVKQIRMGEFAQHEALELNFKKNEDSYVKAYAQASTEHQGVVYSTHDKLDVNNETDRGKFQFAAEQICLLAVMNAAPGTEFDFSVAKEEQQPILRAAFNNAVQKAINDHIFTEEDCPKEKVPLQNARRLN